MVASLPYAAVVLILADRHGIDEMSTVAFRGRLQHFQRLGFPAGINTGRGRSVAYSFGQLLELSLAIELIQMGLTPERAVAVLRSSKFAVYQSVSSAVENESIWFKKENDFWLGYLPSAMTAAFNKNRGTTSDEEQKFFFGGTPFISDLLGSMQGSGRSCVALIHLSGLLRHLGSWWIGWTKCSQADMIESIKEWLAEQTPLFDEAPDDEPDEVGAVSGGFDASDPQT